MKGDSPGHFFLYALPACPPSQCYFAGAAAALLQCGRPPHCCTAGGAVVAAVFAALAAAPAHAPAPAALAAVLLALELGAARHRCACRRPGRVQALPCQPSSYPAPRPCAQCTAAGPAGSAAGAAAPRTRCDSRAPLTVLPLAHAAAAQLLPVLWLAGSGLQVGRPACDLGAVCAWAAVVRHVPAAGGATRGCLRLSGGGAAMLAQPSLLGILAMSPSINNNKASPSSGAISMVCDLSL